MNRFGISLAVLTVWFASVGCGVSKGTLEEELAALKTELQADAASKSEAAAQDVKGTVMKRVVEIETSFATRAAMEEAIRKSQVKTLDDCDKKLAVLEGQVEEMKKRVDVTNMANKEEIYKVLDHLRTTAVTLVEQLKVQRESIDAAIKKLEGISVPETPDDGEKPK